MANRKLIMQIVFLFKFNNTNDINWKREYKGIIIRDEEFSRRCNDNYSQTIVYKPNLL